VDNPIVLHSTVTDMAAFIPSAQVQADGQPRFQIPAHAGNVAWDAAAADEAAGGVEADIRIFLDAQCAEGDVVVDLDPGFGFIALSAATAPNGMPTVLVYGLSDAHAKPLQDAAADAGGWFDVFGRDRIARLGTDVQERLGEQGRVFVHCNSADVPRVCTALATAQGNGQLLAVCVSDAERAAGWANARAALASIGFVPAQIAEQNDQIVLLPVQGAPRTPVIALPSELLGNA
jgi:hypothetical protein